MSIKGRFYLSAAAMALGMLWSAPSASVHAQQSAPAAIAIGDSDLARISHTR